MALKRILKFFILIGDRSNITNLIQLIKNIKMCSSSKDGSLSKNNYTFIQGASNSIYVDLNFYNNAYYTIDFSTSLIKLYRSKPVSFCNILHLSAIDMYFCSSKYLGPKYLAIALKKFSLKEIGFITN